MSELLNRHKGLIEKVNKNILVEGCGKPETDLFKLKVDVKEGIARCVENLLAFDRKQAIEEGLQRNLTEASVIGTGLSDVGPYTKFGINLIAAVMASTVAQSIISVQPMERRVGEVRFIKHIYMTNKDGASIGDTISSALEYNGGHNLYTASSIAEEQVPVAGSGGSASGTLLWKPVLPNTVKVTATVSGSPVEIKDDGNGKLIGTGVSNGTINYATGAMAFTVAAAPSAMVADYTYNTTDIKPEVAEVKTTIEVMAMKAQDRKLKTAFSYDAAFDLQKDYGVDLEEETIGYFAQEIAAEIDGEIMDDLKRMALSQQDRVSTFDQKAPTGVSQADHDDSFWNYIVEGGNGIFKRIKRGRPSFVIAGVDVCSTIETMRQFKPSNFAATGPHIVGTVKGVNIIKNPYYQDKEYIVGYQGPNKLDTGYVYAPYMPLLAIKGNFEGNLFNKAIGFMTAYGKAFINPKCYIHGVVTKS